MRTTYGVPGLSGRRDSFDASCDADERCELQVLMRDQDEPNRAAFEPEFLEQEVGLKATESEFAALLPEALHRSEPFRVELPPSLRQVHSPRGGRLRRLAAAGTTEPVEFFDVMWRQPLEVRVPNRESMEGHRVPESPRNQDPNGPFVYPQEQVGVPRQEDAEVGRNAARHEVDEHVTPVFLGDADRQLVWKVADGLLPAFPERQLRIDESPILLERIIEVGDLVALGPEPPVRRVREHCVEQHQPLDEPARGGGPPIAVVRLSDGLVQRLVLPVKKAAPLALSCRDPGGVVAPDKVGQKVLRFLPMLDAHERPVLPFDEDT